MNRSYGKRLASKLVPLVVASFAFFFYAASIDCVALTNSVMVSLTSKNGLAHAAPAVSGGAVSVRRVTTDTFAAGASDPRYEQFVHESESGSWCDTVDDIRHGCVAIAALLSAYFLLGKETTEKQSKSPLWLRVIVVVVIPFAVNSIVTFVRDNFGAIGGGL